MGKMEEVRKGRKHDQVIEGALRIFLRDGFEGASVDDIAREAGVSKATLYSYFPDKRILFTQVFTGECQRQAGDAEAEMGAAMGAAEVLHFIGHLVVDFMMSDFGRSLFRLVVAEVSRFPELAREFYTNGPGLLRARMVARLQLLVDAGELAIEDKDLAAEQFIQLCGALIQDRLMLDLVEDIQPEELERSVTSAVEMFMARYGTGKTRAVAAG